MFAKQQLVKEGSRTILYNRTISGNSTVSCSLAGKISTYRNLLFELYTGIRCNFSPSTITIFAIYDYLIGHYDKLDSNVSGCTSQ